MAENTPLLAYSPEAKSPDDSELERPRARRASESGWSWSEPGVIPAGRLDDPSLKSTTDEVFNSASHLVGAMISLLGTAVLVVGAAETGNPWAIASFSVYGVTLIGCFLASFSMHGLDCGRGCNRVLLLVDRLMIYYLIAGTATPVCLVCLSDSMYGWIFFGTLWLLAIAGTLLQAWFRFPQWGSLSVFLTMGWFGGLLAFPAFPCMGWKGFSWFLGGGLAYTVGAFFFATETPKGWPIPGKFEHHEIWHLFVLTGAGCHWALMFTTLLPRALEQANADYHDNWTLPFF